MQDLIQLLKDKAGLTEEQAHKSLLTIKEYIQSKLPPMMAGMVDNFMGMNANDEEDYTEPMNSADDDDDVMHKAKKASAEAAEKIETMAEEAKEEVESFAKEASQKIDVWAVKAEEAAQEAINKLKDMLGEQKKNGH